jgi:hypothetical protein
MARKKKRSKSRFAGKISENANSRKRGSGYGYLNLPKGVDLFIPTEDSKVLMDILPYEVTDHEHPDKNPSKEIAVEGTLWYKRPFKIHRNVGVNKKTVICPRSFSKRCPICDYRDELISDGYDKNKVNIDATRPSERNAYAIIVKEIDEKPQSDKIRIFDFSDYFFQEILEEQGKAADIDKFNIFPDHEEGYSLRVRFAKSDFGPKSTRFDFVERDEQYTDDILEEVPSLDELFETLPYDDLKLMFMELPVDEEEEEEEERPVRKKRNERKKRRLEEKEEDEELEEEEEEEEEDEDLEEEEEEKESPRRKKKNLGKRKHRTKVEEEPDEEEDEDEDLEDEEEEEPVRKKRTKRTTKTKPKSKRKKCPSGHKFGTDNEAFDDCDECPIWNECAEEFDRLQNDN